MSLDDEGLRSLVECLNTIAGERTILEPEALEALKHALLRRVPCYHIGLARAEAPGFFRMLAMTRGHGEGALPLRARLASIPGIYEAVYERGECFRSTSLTAGTNLERTGADFGFGSYIAVPVQLADITIASLLVGFRETDMADRVDEAFLRALARGMARSVERGLDERHHERAARILETSGDAMLAWDPEGRIVDANAAAEELVGSPRPELIGASVQDIFRSMPLGTASNQRLALSRRDGTRIVVAATISPVRGDPLVFAHALLRDLSEVVAAEADAAERLAELRQLSEQHTLLLNNAPLLIFRLDPEDGRILYLNHHAEHLFGVSEQTALETPDFLRNAHMDPEGVLAFEEAWIVARLGQVMPPYEARLRRESGEPLIARGAIYPVLDAARTITGIEGILLDVTQERAARSRLLQADRLATVGMLSAGVAHEINNPAAFMLLGLDVLARTLSGPQVSLQPPAKQQVSQLITDLKETGRRIVDIARDMRLFASPPNPNDAKRPLVDVARVVESALTITRAQIVEKAELVVDLDTDLPLVAIDEGRLGQVLVNLLVNAAQAIGAAREARGARVGGDMVRIAARVADKAVEIEISDTGIGMTQEVMDRAFVPFFTTSRADTGTGLGLAIARTLIEGVGGTVLAHSPASCFPEPVGARLVIRLPALHAVSSIASESDRTPTALRGTVLIIEDEVLLGKALADQLSEVHHVVVVSGPNDALRALSEARFDVVLCDINMPVMSGDDLHAEVRASDDVQAQRFVFMTGVNFGKEVDTLVSQLGLPLLEKPFPMRRALATIDDVLTRLGPIEKKR